MRAEEYLHNGDIEGALSCLQEEIRNAPSKPELRIFIFQLLALMGQWDRAMTQLNVAAEMDSESLLMAHMYRPALNSEALRAEIFEGNRTPLMLGEPLEWTGYVAEALGLLAQGKTDAAAALRDQAFESASGIAGTIDDQPFEWIADADPRLGPVLEVVVDGKYYWVPFERIQEIRIEEPVNLRDVIWVQAHLVLVNGGEVPGLIPARYPGSEKQPDSAVRMARKTDWVEMDNGFYQGLGQRMLATDQNEYPLLETRQIVLNHSVADQA